MFTKGNGHEPALIGFVKDGESRPRIMALIEDKSTLDALLPKIRQAMGCQDHKTEGGAIAQTLAVQSAAICFDFDECKIIYLDDQGAIIKP